MSEAEQEKEQGDVRPVPATGFGSPKGRRWFVSRHPGFVAEVVAEKVLDHDGNRAPFIRVAFKSEKKSALHIGDGRLGSNNPSGSDTNSNKHYGLFMIEDPGEGPFDRNDAERDANGWNAYDRRRIVDHLRRTHAYKVTPQDNQYRVSAKLVELNWDPAEIRIAVENQTLPSFNRPMGRPNIPDDMTRPEVQTAAPAQMGRRRSIAV